jgi:muconate cycloisomerase
MAYGLQLPMGDRYRMSVANYEKLQAIGVEIETDDGQVGIGQATITAAAYSPYGETLQGAVHAINDHFAPTLIGGDPLAIEAAHVAMNTVLQGNCSAKCAVDVALHDLAGRILGVPVCSLLGGPLRTELPVLSSIGYFATDELVGKAEKAVAGGYRSIKIRVGEDLQTDIGNLRALRGALGDDIALSVDFNQAMSKVHGRPDRAIGYIRRLEEFDLDTVEQPVAGEDFEGMARITAAIDTPVVADESIWTLQDARRAIGMAACDIIKIKIVKTGGLLFARKMAALCEAAGMALVVGHGIAGAVQNAAEAHLAAALPNWKEPGEMNGYLKLSGDMAGGLPFVDGNVVLNDGPGLGVEPDRDALREFRMVA